MWKWSMQIETLDESWDRMPCYRQCFKPKIMKLERKSPQKNKKKKVYLFCEPTVRKMYSYFVKRKSKTYPNLISIHTIHILCSICNLPFFWPRFKFYCIFINFFLLPIYSTCTRYLWRILSTLRIFKQFLTGPLFVLFVFFNFNVFFNLI